jgi:hypothetical protein
MWCYVNVTTLLRLAANNYDKQTIMMLHPITAAGNGANGCRSAAADT